MKKNLRGRIREYFTSEEGRVGLKGPLTLGVATGSVLLAQTIVGTPKAEAWMCQWNEHCPEGQVCDLGTCRDA